MSDLKGPQPVDARGKSVQLGDSFHCQEKAATGILTSPFDDADVEFGFRIVWDHENMRSHLAWAFLMGIDMPAPALHNGGMSQAGSLRPT